MTRTTTLLLSFLLFQLLHFSGRTAAVSGGGGKWKLLHLSIGITAMHMQLLNNDKVVIYDRTDYGRSNITLPNGICRNDPSDQALKIDCTAHSVEYDVASNSYRPLMVLTDVWCSSGAVMADGTFIQTGGFNDGDRVVRVFKPCIGGELCDWEEINRGLIQRRWYATNHILPDGRQIIIGGRRQFNYEFYPKSRATNRVFNLPFLAQTNDRGIENNLYPFVFLNPDGNLFIFANDRAILFDYARHSVVKTYPQIPGGDPRCYPSTGSAVLLPLKNLRGKATAAEVLVCGGAPKGAFAATNKGIFMRALNTCGRIRVTDQNPQWVMETMPRARVMGDMLLLPNGQVLMINGAASGTAGWEMGRNPVLNPVLYNPINSRFKVLNPTTIPRMYHSTAIVLRDGRVLVGGSNPHRLYEFSKVLYPTELSIESFSPPYLDPSLNNLRPIIINSRSSPNAHFKIGYGQRLAIRFTMLSGVPKGDLVTVTMLAPPFNTHSYSMSQRLLILGGGNVKIVGKSLYQVAVTTPTITNLAPPGYYLVFVVYQDVPSEGIWVHLQ
ncbi:hypothetical protein M9H77_24932 [Catharanthus roseus]|uniref:Uncharacterized protein n=1 Tax=Catharanthus roseus TaxID=4058 RepID=A0ACC0A5R2_CATRO|nr:hypothetical protein M9H77_24932 [Catharanthus roseus]